MEYADQFEQDFAARTQTLLESYGGAYDATLLVNCLVGLLIIPRERSFERIPNDPVSDLSQWGVSSESISSFGKRRPRDQHEPNTVRGFVQSLRNAVAHFQLAPEHKDGQVSAFRFTDRNGFDATIPLDELRAFTNQLAAFLKYT